MQKIKQRKYCFSVFLSTIGMKKKELKMNDMKLLGLDFTNINVNPQKFPNFNFLGAISLNLSINCEFLNQLNKQDLQVPQGS